MPLHATRKHADAIVCHSGRHPPEPFSPTTLASNQSNDAPEVPSATLSFFHHNEEGGEGASGELISEKGATHSIIIKCRICGHRYFLRLLYVVPAIEHILRTAENFEISQRVNPALLRCGSGERCSRHHRNEPEKICVYVHREATHQAHLCSPTI